jgi:hypothetical protein
MSLLVVAGISMMGIFIIKVYYTVKIVKELIDEKKEQGASEILDISDIVNISAKGDEEDLTKQVSKDLIN